MEKNGEVIKIGVFSKHIGQGEKIKIEGDEFILKPLGIEYSGDFLTIAKGFSGAKEGDNGSMFKNFTDDTKDAIIKVIMATLKVSYPDESEEEQKLFGGKYLMTLLHVITKMNGSGGMEEPKGRAKNKIEAIKRMRAKRNDTGSENKE